MFMSWETQNVLKLNFRSNTIPIKVNKFACIYKIPLVINRQSEENKKSSTEWKHLQYIYLTRGLYLKYINDFHISNKKVIVH